MEHGFLRVRCQNCYDERLVAFSCKRRGFCPSCGARRMAESAALLVDEVFTLQTLPDCNEPFDDSVGKVAGFSLAKRVSRLGPMNARSWNVCAATLPYMDVGYLVA